MTKGLNARTLKRAGVALLLVLVWAAALVGGTLFGWWRRAIAPANDSRAFMQAAISMVNAGNRANTALVLIERGAVVAEHYSSRADVVDRDTVFATASMSKWITAHAVMKLVEQGRLDLDRRVETYLTRWHFPPGPFDARAVTARRLLSHTAGLTDGLGFGDYRRDEVLPTLEASLAAPRTSFGNTGTPISIGIEPGTQFLYSGGGYLLLELLVEEISAERFEAFVSREVLQPLGMSRSGYADLAVTANSAQSYDSDGQPATVSRYASNAATGFTTSASDMVRFVGAHLGTVEGSPLTRTTLESMRTAEAKTMGVDVWGLGTVLYAPTRDGGGVYGHDGINEPAMSATVRINPDTKDAIIVLATGSKTLGSQLGAEWVFWETGLPDILTIPNEIRGVMPLLVGGACAIVLLTFAPVWRRRRSNTVRAA